MTEFTYYTIIGKDLDLFKGHVENVKNYAGFNKLPCEKNFNVIIYRNNKIKKETTDSILKYCKEENITPIIYDEPGNSFIENLYACWNLGYETAQHGYVFRGGSDQVYSKDSFLVLYKIAEKLSTEFPKKKVILQANTIECKSRLKIIKAKSRHFEEDFGENFSNMNYENFEKFIEKINAPVKEDLLTIDMALKYWKKPGPFYGKFGKTSRTDGCSWLMTKKDWIDHGPLPSLENKITGDVIIHDRFQENGYENYIVRDCITYHFVQGESNGEQSSGNEPSVENKIMKKIKSFVKSKSISKH
ncbi:MAG: hypothetical protein ACE5RF_03850 [Nitrosarchaeum sp.]